MSLFLFGGRWLLDSKPALRNDAGGTFQPAWLARRPTTSKNFNGCSRSKAESTTGRAGTRVAVRPWAAIANPGRHAPNRRNAKSARAQSEGKNRLFDSEINLHRLFGAIYCHLRRYPVGAHNVRPGNTKSYGSWANTPTSLRAAYGGCSLDLTAVCVFALRDIWCKTMSQQTARLRFHHFDKTGRPFIITDIRTALTVRCGRSPNKFRV